MTRFREYYAVIFTNQHTLKDNEAYGDMAERMAALAKTMPGYIGFESARNPDGSGIAVSYWESEEAIANWKREAEHVEAQRRGRETWYSDYMVRVAKVEREYKKKRGDE